MMGDSVTIALTLFFCLVYFSGEVVVHKVKSSHRNKPRHHYRRTPKGRNTPRRKHVDLFHTGYHRPHALYLEPALAWLSAPPRSRHTPTPVPFSAPTVAIPLPVTIRIARHRGVPGSGATTW